jgi:lycopene cyclase domain-containing protein
VTYLQFHLVFTLPPLLLLALLTWRAFYRGRVPRAGLVALGVHVLLALLYTTPWDNYLVARGVWGYGEGRVLFTLGLGAVRGVPVLRHPDAPDRTLAAAP